MTAAETYIEGKPQWRSGLKTLRSILLEYPFEEHIKWNAPVYCYKGRNLVGLSAFKNHFGLWFFEGASLKDSAGVLSNAQKDKTKYMRQWKFTDTEAIDPQLIKAYLEETLELARNTTAPERNRKEPEKAEMPEVMKEAFEKEPDLAGAFYQFPNYKQREFLEYLREAKREATCLRRLEKIKVLIRKGEGLNDKYR